MDALRATGVTTGWLLTSNGPDVFSWGIEGSRRHQFSTKCTWDFLRPSAPMVTWFKTVWFKHATPRHAFHFWTANLNRLPTKDRMIQWGVNVSEVCVLCNLSPEARHHIFLACPFSLQVWDRVLQRFEATPSILTTWLTLLQWMRTPTRSFSRTLKCLAAQAIIYLLWHERNNRIHTQVSLTVEALFRKIDQTVRDSLLARLRKRGCEKLLSQWFTHA
ncbi:uncharacterized protein LOC112088431 [Eutrema salsugineum]|uniref:uncharacterized protein LOC112088431 n=1 Tax=Eutrema salsugineum TaxID=72664 RepID=UPI000CED4365|nr:uncharacterized protein LOC112088431 [Eutrema salsugineum]